jgi:hypothetical protein
MFLTVQDVSSPEYKIGLKVRETLCKFYLFHTVSTFIYSYISIFPQSLVAQKAEQGGIFIDEIRI